MVLQAFACQLMTYKPIYCHLSGCSFSSNTKESVSHILCILRLVAAGSTARSFYSTQVLEMHSLMGPDLVHSTGEEK